MNLLITIEVEAPNDTPPQKVIDEISSNVESCNWAVVHTYYEIIEGGPRAND